MTTATATQIPPHHYTIVNPSPDLSEAGTATHLASWTHRRGGHYEVYADGATLHPAAGLGDRDPDPSPEDVALYESGKVYAAVYRDASGGIVAQRWGVLGWGAAISAAEALGHPTPAEAAERHARAAEAAYRHALAAGAPAHCPPMESAQEFAEDAQGAADLAAQAQAIGDAEGAQNAAEAAEAEALWAAHWAGHALAYAAELARENLAARVRARLVANGAKAG